jgi:threonylcarbamoyladenosine tRNA methylthiotransferase MtaB
VERGFKEIVLTGTHIGQYRADGCRGIGSLLERILRIEGDFRVRLSSIDARELDRELFDLIAGEARVCKHLHVSVQSLSPRVLRAMGRPTTDTGPLLELLSEVHRVCPDCSLGGDFIVGFPGESESMFEQTCEGIERAGFTYGHVFRYSPRPGTRAAAMPDQVSGEVKRRRARHLRDLLGRRRRAFVAGQRGTRLRIVVERQRPVRGLTSNYLHVALDGTNAARNSWLDVVLSGDVAADGRHCTARLVGDTA